MTFSTDEVLLAYLTLVNAVGEEADRDLLFPLLGRSPEIHLRAAGLLRRYGFERYEHILNDALFSPKQAMSSLTSDVLAELADNASLAQLASAFIKTEPMFDRTMAKTFAAHCGDARYVRFLRERSEGEREQMRQGLLRALQTSQSIEDVRLACQALSLLLEANAAADIREYAAPPHPTTLRCGVMRWLAANADEGRLPIFRANLADEHLEVANTAFLLLQAESPVT